MRPTRLNHSKLDEDCQKTAELIESLKNHSADLREVIVRSRETLDESRNALCGRAASPVSTVHPVEPAKPSCAAQCGGHGLARAVAVKGLYRTVTYECDTCHGRWEITDESAPK